MCPEVLPKRGAVWFPDCRPQFLLRIRLASRWQHTRRAPAGYATSKTSRLVADHKAFARASDRPCRHEASAQRRRGASRISVPCKAIASSAAQLAATFGKAEPAISTSGVRRACVQVGPKPRFFRENARGAVACSVPQTPLLSASAGQRPRRQGQLQPCPAFPEWDWRSRLPVR